ncbi:Transport and Golgi organization protein 1 [Manis javanica]|nr:Transport and Golgi organization protein 1 [Manis javanica]
MGCRRFKSGFQPNRLQAPLQHPARFPHFHLPPPGSRGRDGCPATNIRPPDQGQGLHPIPPNHGRGQGYPVGLGGLEPHTAHRKEP